MKMLSFGAAILLFTPACRLAQASTPSTDPNPISSTQSGQQPGKSQTATLEGCLSGNVDMFVLTRPSGKSYEITGDTAQLAGRIGHKVRLWGQIDSAADAELITAGGPHTAFAVEKAQSLSTSCK
jgi:hypothetical protein